MRPADNLQFVCKPPPEDRGVCARAVADPLGLRRSVCLLAGRGWGEGLAGLERPRFHQNSPAEEGKAGEDALDWSLFLELKPLDVWAFHFGQRL